jgi:hypothetical protein
MLKVAVAHSQCWQSEQRCVFAPVCVRALDFIFEAMAEGMTGYSGEAERSFRREAELHSGMIPNTIGA